MKDPRLETERDNLARLTAQLDQTQTLINEARLLFKDDPVTMKNLDVKQAHADELRKEIAHNRQLIKILSD